MAGGKRSAPCGDMHHVEELHRVPADARTVTNQHELRAPKRARVAEEADSDDVHPRLACEALSPSTPDESQDDASVAHAHHEAEEEREKRANETNVDGDSDCVHAPEVPEIPEAEARPEAEAEAHRQTGSPCLQNSQMTWKRGGNASIVCALELRFSPLVDLLTLWLCGDASATAALARWEAESAMPPARETCTVWALVQQDHHDANVLRAANPFQPANRPTAPAQTEATRSSEEMEMNAPASGLLERELFQESLDELCAVVDARLLRSAIEHIHHEGLQVNVHAKMVAKQSKYLDLLPQSSEWAGVERRFREGAHGGRRLKLVRVQKVHNVFLQRRFVAFQELLQHKPGFSGVNERVLFHGTGGNNPDAVCLGSEGFDPRLCKDGNKLGRCVHFSLRANVSALHYAHRLRSKQTGAVIGRIVMARVSCGNVCNVTRYTRKVRPPPLADNPHVLYDSVMYQAASFQGTSDPCFVGTFDASQAVPEYLITFQEMHPSP